MSKGIKNWIVALFTAASLFVSPIFSQAQEAASQGVQSQGQTGESHAQTAPASGADKRTVILGPDYSEGKKWFPAVFAPYTPMEVSEPQFTNSPRIGQLIENGKLMLSLDDAISLALENNLAIAVERYTPWLDQVNLLRAKSGVNGLVPFDPTLAGAFNVQDSNTPINNPLFAGIIPTPSATPTRAIPLSYIQHIGNANLLYTQYLPTGTEIQAGITNNRTSVNYGSYDLYNPDFQSALTVQITQPLLRGFGTLPNTRLILEAKNIEKAGLSQLTQQVIATVTQVSNDYWELVYGRENVKVEQAAVQTSQKLYDDNGRRLSNGTLSPLDSLTAKSQLASDKQALVQAQSVQLQDETTLLNDITKNPLDGGLTGIEIIPTTPISLPNVIEDIPIEDAVKEAWQKRPELQQQALTLKNAAIEVKASKNELLPELDIFGEYTATGIGGLQTAEGTTQTGTYVSGIPIVNAAGMPVPGLFEGTALTTSSQVIFPGGLGEDLSRVFRARYPSFEAGITFTLPIRNRAAQADNAQAVLDERQQQTQYRQEQNAIFVSVRNALIALREDRASLDAANEARDLAEQTFKGEQERYGVGSSTSYNIVLRSRDVTVAEAIELRDRINLIEDELKFNQATGRTLEVNNITMADALNGKISVSPNIPGTPGAGFAEGR